MKKMFGFATAISLAAGLGIFWAANPSQKPDWFGSPAGNLFSNELTSVPDSDDPSMEECELCGGDDLGASLPGETEVSTYSPATQSHCRACENPPCDCCPGCRKAPINEGPASANEFCEEQCLGPMETLKELANWLDFSPIKVVSRNKLPKVLDEFEEEEEMMPYCPDEEDEEESPSFMPYTKDKPPATSKSVFDFWSQLSSDPDKDQPDSVQKTHTLSLIFGIEGVNSDTGAGLTGRIILKVSGSEESEPVDATPACEEDPNYQYQYPGCPYTGPCPTTKKPNLLFPGSTDEPKPGKKKSPKPHSSSRAIFPRIPGAWAPKLNEKAEDNPRHPEVDTMEFRPTDGQSGRFETRNEEGPH